MLRPTLFVTILISFSDCTRAQENAPQINVVYGEKHIFTIETPTGWKNDVKFAEKIGLVNFFSPQGDTLVKQQNYMYAMGYDKAPVKQTLQEFIQADLKEYKQQYPNFKFEKIDIGFNGGIKNGQLYSFSNLNDRFKEEVLFAETNETIIVFSFSVTTEEKYKQYQRVFDSFVKSFMYRGNDPKAFLEYMSQRKNK